MKKAILLILLLPLLSCAQYFDVFDIDTSDYPIINAKLDSIDEHRNQNLDHNPSDFNKLIEEMNLFLTEYKDLFPNPDVYYPIPTIGITSQEREDLIKNVSVDEELSIHKDSIQSYYLIDFYHSKIVSSIYQILEHPQFSNFDVSKMIVRDDIFLVKSDDNKLFNISLDKKTGGSYRTRTSIMYYTDLSKADTTKVESNYSIFAENGYSNIYTIQTDEGIKYVLTGGVRGCNTCFESFIQLVSFTENKFNKEFEYSVSNRDWNDGVRYDQETKTINVDYHLDDLTPYCSCEYDMDEDQFHSEENDLDKNSIICKCKFIFNGKTFELVEEGWRKTEPQTK